MAHFKTSGSFRKGPRGKPQLRAPKDHSCTKLEEPHKLLLSKEPTTIASPFTSNKCDRLYCTHLEYITALSERETCCHLLRLWASCLKRSLERGPCVYTNSLQEIHPLRGVLLKMLLCYKWLLSKLKSQTTGGKVFQ